VEAASIPWRPIGELFVEKGSITPDQLEEALAEQAATGLRLGEVLVKRNLISSPELTQALMEQLGREVAREEGFGTGLWSAIRRRNASHDSEADPVPLEADRPPFGAGLTRKLGVVPDEPDAPGPSDSATIEEAEFERVREVLVQPADEKADQAEADILRESLTEAHVEIRALRQGVAEREERLEALATEIATLREAAESRDSTVRAKGLEQELSTVRAEVDELTISLAGANGKASELESTLTAERQAHGETRHRLDEATLAEENARQARVEIERDFGAMQAERDAARSEASALRDQIVAAETALGAEREAHADTRRHAEQTAADAAQVRQVVNGFDQERCELAERARTLEEDLVTRQATESRLGEQLEASQGRTAELDDQVSSLTAQLEEIEQERLALIDRAQTLEEDLASRQANGSRLEEELQAANHRSDELNGQIAGLSQELDSVRRERDDLAERARMLEEDLASREANGSHLEEQLHAAEGRAAELNDQVVSLGGGLASAESVLEEAEAAREAARRDAEIAADKLNAAEARITELHATVDGFEGEKAELSKAFSDQRLALEQELGTVGARLAEESAAHSETRCVLSHALTELAAREPVPILGDESEPGPQDYLCFIPKNDGYRLVGRTGLLPAAGDECDVDGVAHAVTRVARSPLPFDSRTCVYLLAAG
jgi:chromosome segregation ATPase